MNAIVDLLRQAEMFYRRAIRAGDLRRAHRHQAIWRAVWAQLCSKTGNAEPVQQ